MTGKRKALAASCLLVVAGGLVPRACTTARIRSCAALVIAIMVLAGCGQNPSPAAGTAPPPPPSGAGDRKGPEAGPVQPAQAQPVPAPGQPPPAEAKKMRRVKALVSGRVQNVGFRAFTTAQANQLGLTGYVLNLKDGRVEAVIEGPDDKVEELIKAIKTGPPGARVDGVQLEEQPHRGEFRSFTIGR